MAKIPHDQKWQQQLAERYALQQAQILITTAKAYYDEYCPQHCGVINFKNRN